MKWFILITWRPQPVTQRLTTCNQASPRTVPVAVWTRSFNLTGRERFAAGRFLARVDANRTLAPSTLESGSRPEQVWTRPKCHLSWGIVFIQPLPMSKPSQPLLSKEFCHQVWVPISRCVITAPVELYILGVSVIHITTKVMPKWNAVKFREILSLSFEIFVDSVCKHANMHNLYFLCHSFCESAYSCAVLLYPAYIALSVLITLEYLDIIWEESCAMPEITSTGLWHDGHCQLWLWHTNGQRHRCQMFQALGEHLTLTFNSLVDGQEWWWWRKLEFTKG